MITRIDQWLWAARLFKTRTLANQACRGGRVQICGATVKPSHPVRIVDLVAVAQRPIVRQYLVKELAVKRVSAALAQKLLEEITPAVELEKLALFRKDPLSLIFAHRPKGAGRPTKRERRDLEKLVSQSQENPDDKP
jgi:ribosome-associated heat shock protein Hsp15